MTSKQFKTHLGELKVFVRVFSIPAIYIKIANPEQAYTIVHSDL